MNDKDTIKYIDLIIKDIDDFDFFGIDNIVLKHLTPDEKNKKEYYSKLIEKIVLFGQNNDLFVLRNKNGGFKLTEKGKRLKLSNKTFNNFQRSENKTEWYNKNWVGYLIAFIVFLFTVYQHFDNRSLKRDYNTLDTQYDSLKSQFDSYKDSISELKPTDLKVMQLKELDSLTKY
jgi:hypothetical protein